jgi:hypothetical protein
MINCLPVTAITARGDQNFAAITCIGDRSHRQKTDVWGTRDLISDVDCLTGSSRWHIMEVAMIRCIDLIGIAGFGILVVSTLFLFPNSVEKMTWTYWLEGPVLWFVAFVFLVGWLILRWSVPQSHGGPPPLLVWSITKSKNKEVTAGANEKVRKKAA